MALTHWNPWRELEDMSSRLNSIFKLEGGNGDVTTMTVSDWSPRADIKENVEEYVVTAELPGVPKDDIKVSVKDGVLSISGERRSEKEEKGSKTHRIERFYGSFCRSFSLPEGVDENKIAADTKEGLLYVHLPKSPTAKTPSKEIRVK